MHTINAKATSVVATDGKYKFKCTYSDEYIIGLYLIKKKFAVIVYYLDKKYS